LIQNLSNNRKKKLILNIYQFSTKPLENAIKQREKVKKERRGRSRAEDADYITERESHTVERSNMSLRERWVYIVESNSDSEESVREEDIGANNENVSDIEEDNIEDFDRL
jgi:hypothetical protein